MSNDKQKENINKSAMFRAAIPLILSVIVLGSLYYAFFIREKDPEILRIATGLQGSTTQELMEAIGSQLQANNKNIKVIYVETKGTSQNIKFLDENKIDVAAIPSDIIARPSFSLVATLYPDTYHLIVREDAGINTIHDLPSKIIAVPPTSSGAYRSFWYLIGQYGLSPEAIKARSMSPNEAFTALRKNKIDAMFYLAPPANRQTRWIAEAVRVKLLPIDQANAMALRRHALNPAIIPKGIYAGRPPVPPTDIQTVSANRILITRRDVPDHLIRALTATMFENRRELTTNSILATFISQPDMSKGTILPVHPGAVSFYDRNQPSFFQQNAEPIGVIMSVIAVMLSGLLWVKRRWEERQKGRIDVYNLDLLDITEAARAANTPQELDTSRNNLFDMLTQVVRDLDDDKIDGEGFHFFAFTWEAACAVISEKERKFGIKNTLLNDAKENLTRLKDKPSS